MKRVQSRDAVGQVEQTSVDRRPLVRCCPACARRVDIIEDVPLAAVEGVRVFRELRAPLNPFRGRRVDWPAPPKLSLAEREAEATFQQEARDVARLPAVRRYLDRIARLVDAKVPTGRLLPTWREGWTRWDAPIPGSPCREDWVWVIWVQTRWDRRERTSLRARLDVCLMHQNGTRDSMTIATRVGRLGQLRVLGHLTARGRST